MKRFFVAAFVVSMMSATGAHAETGTFENPQQLPDSITVTANRDATPLREIGSSIIVITQQEIENSPATNVADLLEEQAGINVVKTGNAGNTTSLFLRGANAHHTLVILDGIELNDPSSPNGAFDFAHLNLDNIQRIEILSGPQSVLYGSDAIGGVVQIFTKRGSGRSKVALESSFGSYNTFNESVNFSGSENKFDYALSLGRKDTDGISSAVAGNEKDGYNNTDFSSQLGYMLTENTQLTASGRYTESEVDIDQTSGVFDDPNYRSDNKTKLFSANIESLRATCWNYKVSFTLADQSLVTTDEPDDEHQLDAMNYTADGSRYKLHFQNRFDLLPMVSFITGLEYEKENYSSSIHSESIWGPYDDAVEDIDNDAGGLYALTALSITDNWFGTIGGRYDSYANYDDALTYRITTAYNIDKLGLKLKANVGTGFKTPSLFQKNHPLYGNPLLEAEESYGWETGFDYRLKNHPFAFSFVYFNTKFTNLIENNANIAESKSRGVELNTSYNLNNTGFDLKYTYNEASDKSGNALVRRPSDKFNFSVEQKINAKFILGLNGMAISSRYDLDFNAYPAERVRLEGYTLFNLFASYQLSNNFTLTGRIENLFDKEYIEVYTFNTASRAIYAGLKISL